MGAKTGSLTNFKKTGASDKELQNLPVSRRRAGRHRPRENLH